MEEKKKTVYMTNMDLERITAELKNKRQLVYWMVSRSSPLVCRFEEHGSNRGLGTGEVGSEPDIDVLGQADAHQVDIVLEETYLFVYRYPLFLIVIEDMAQETTEFVDGTLSFLAVEGYKGIDVVEGVEKEMGFDLQTEILQLGLTPRTL